MAPSTVFSRAFLLVALCWPPGGLLGTLLRVEALPIVPETPNFAVYGHQDSRQEIHLKTKFDIPDAASGSGAKGELGLPIHVPNRQLAIDGDAAAHVVAVRADHLDGFFGVGEVIDIVVEFSSEVFVDVTEGEPSLLMRTGCNRDVDGYSDYECFVPEIQSFFCASDSGKFALVFDVDNGATNIDVLDDPLEVKHKIEEQCPKITDVDVRYSDGNQICSSEGVTTYITFNEVNIPGDDGDLPEMVPNKYNIAVGSGVGLVNVDGDGTVLYHGSTVILSDAATEVQKGVKYSNRVAPYISGDSTTELTFRYTVEAGDESIDLEYFDRYALTLNGALIYTKTGRSDRSTHDTSTGGLTPVYDYVNANLQLPRPGLVPHHPSSRGSSLSHNANIKIDTTPPTVINVDVPDTEDDKYGVGEALTILVQFSAPIVVDGSPTLLVETGTTDRLASFVSVTDDTLEFLYTVRTGDSTQDLSYGDYLTALSVNGGTIKRLSTNSTTDVNLELPIPGVAGSLSKNRAIVIDVSPPTPKLVTTSAADGTYGQGQELDFYVTFDSPVEVSGIPSLQIATGQTTLFSGSTLRSVDVDTDPRAFYFPLDHGLTTETAAGFEFLFTSDTYSQTLVVDTVDEYSVVHMTSDWTNGLVTFVVEDTGCTVDLATGAKTCTGTSVYSVPAVTISTPVNRGAVYIGGTGTDVLTFRLTIGAGDSTSGAALQLGAVIDLNGGTIQRLSTASITNANLGMADLTDGILSLADKTATNIVVDTTQPAVTKVFTTKPDGTYVEGEIIDVQVEFDMAVSVDEEENARGVAIPVLYLDTEHDSGSDARAIYHAGSGTDTLVLLYTVQTKDRSGTLDLEINAADALQVNFGSVTGYVRRFSTRPMTAAVLTLPAPRASASLVRDTTLADTSDLLVKWDAVRVAGITSITADGTYSGGDTIVLNIEFSAAVDVDTAGGVPYITMDADGCDFFTKTPTQTAVDMAVNDAWIARCAAMVFDDDKPAYYTAGTGTTTLAFTYVVRASDSTLDLDLAQGYTDYLRSTRVQLNGGTILDAGAMAVSLTLPVGTAAGSLALAHALVLDNTEPQVVCLNTAGFDGRYSVGEQIYVDLDFSREVVKQTEVAIMLEVGTTDHLARYHSGSGTSRLTFVYDVQAGEASSDLDAVTSNGLIRKGLNSALEVDAGAPFVTTAVDTGTGDGYVPLLPSFLPSFLFLSLFLLSSSFLPSFLPSFLHRPSFFPSFLHLPFFLHLPTFLPSSSFLPSVPSSSFIPSSSFLPSFLHLPCVLHLPYVLHLPSFLPSLLSLPPTFLLSFLTIPPSLSPSLPLSLQGTRSRRGWRKTAPPTGPRLSSGRQ
jgi:hypothetical protein